MPAVVGGGMGDIDEVLTAGAHLARTGVRLYLLRLPGRPWPRAIDGPWAWPPVATVHAPVQRHPRALTVTPCFGLSAAPPRDAAYGRPGPWAQEAAEIERAYGAEATVHLSLEEFGRTYPAVTENRERFREGGVPRSEWPTRDGGRQGERDVARWRTAFRRFRALDAGNVLHLLATFQPDARFGREFPEIVQTGPLWPVSSSPARPRPPGQDGYRVVWYASPASSPTIARKVALALVGLDRPGDLTIRAPRPVLPDPPEGVRVRELPALSPVAWQRLSRSADLRIVTGSRTLLEALAQGGPFLYFNGVTGGGRRRRRHRPEKVAGLLRLFRSLGVAPGLCDDLDRFSRGQRVVEVVGRAVGDPRWRRAFPSPSRVRSAVPTDAGKLLRRIAREWSGFEGNAEGLVRRYRNRPRLAADPRPPRS